MPQLDISTYSSQVFWLLLSWGLLFLYLYKVFVPRMSKRFAHREKNLEKLLEEADKIHQQTESIKITSEEALREAKQKHQESENAVIQEIQKKSEALKQELKSDLNSEIAAYEVKVQAEQKRLVSDISKQIASELSKTSEGQMGIKVDPIDLQKAIDKELQQ